MMNNRAIRVLVVDDDFEDSQLVTIALKRAFPPIHDVVSVLTLEDASQFLDESDVDIVLLDLGLRTSQGIETLEAFRMLNDQLPVIVLSGLEDEAIATAALERNAQDYLIKDDCNSRVLSKAIRYAIHRQNSIQEIRHLLSRVKENEDVLRRKNLRLKTLYETAHTFVDNVSHEFRTPLTVIKEYVSLVRDGTMGEINEEQSRFLRIAEDRSDDLNTMVDDMLDVSRLEAGMLSVCRKMTNIHEMVDRVLPSLTRKASLKDLKLDVNIPDDLVAVYCDSEKAQRVIVNLGINAMKFTNPGGEIEIWAREEDANIVLGVTDNGPGIAKEKLKSIFERFEQVDVNIRSSTKGFGLGLNIATELARLNLGSMDVESETGVGSTFSFTLPKYDPVEVTSLYIDHLLQRESKFATLLIATIPTTASEESAADIDLFLNLLTRGHDLSFRASTHRWLIIVPEPATEAQLFVERTKRELESVNRNRPRGPLPTVELHMDGTWTNLRITTEELVGRVRTCMEQSGQEQGKLLSV